MARHADPATIARLDAVQRARRAGAEAALAAARDSEARAGDAAQSARDRRDADQDLWFDYLGRSGFAPEYARAMANRLVASDAAATEADERLRLAVQMSEQRVADWRAAEAHVRATGKQLTNARRGAARRHEERRLAVLADRVTFDWMTR